MDDKKKTENNSSSSNGCSLYCLEMAFLFFLFPQFKKLLFSKFSNFSPLGSMCDTHILNIAYNLFFLLLLLLASWNFLFKLKKICLGI